MALADIVQKITSEAEAEAARMRAQAEEEAQRIQTDAEEEYTRMRTAAHTANTAHAETAAARVSSKAAHHARLEREAARAEAIARVFTEAEARLAALPSQEYTAFIALHARALAHMNGTVTVPSEREKETKEALKHAGLTAQNTVTAPVGTLVGGFILETEDALYDYSLKTLLARAREEGMASLAHTLFA